MYWLENQWQLRGCGVDCVNKVIDLTHRDTTNAGSNPARSILLNLNNMKIEKSVTEKITWDFDLCEAEASIVHENGRIITQVVGINKRVETSKEKRFSSFWSDDPRFIKDVHKALGDYIQNVEEITRGVTHKTTKVIE